ncbi:hypothetical protein JCM8097_005461 [Rhodosporidiobolus ruineniae]
MTVPPHPYRQGNYLPIREERAMERCSWEGELPVELAGGMYVRNGGEPALKGEAKENGSEPAYHWFDGDGMLTGVFFDIQPASSSQAAPSIVPTFVNKYILTDVYLASAALGVTEPILPSIATLLGSFRTLHLVLFSILRAVFLAFCSFFTATPLRHLSVANTSVLWHDGRALATCESGPPAWVSLPELDTVGWWSLEGDNGEAGLRQGMLGWMKEWTTAHPKRDPVTGELMLYHCSFLPPYLSYSVIPATAFPPASEKAQPPRTPRILSAPVPIGAPKMIHDMGASRTHSILLDLPLSLDPRNLACGQPVITYSPSSPSRFGVLPRHSPQDVRWFEAPACIVFHVAFAADEYRSSAPSTLYPSPVNVEAVNLVCCRLNSSRLVYSAGNLAVPPNQLLPAESKCELYYYRFPLNSTLPLRPSHAFPLAAIPFEFPTVPTRDAVGPAKYVYGCSVKHGSFDAALGSAAKIDCLVKINVDSLVARGKKRDEAGEGDSELAVDGRTVTQVLAEQTPRTGGTEDVNVRIFELPPHHYAQESSFVPRANGRSEDDGFLLTYVFDERQLDERGVPRPDAQSELWVIDAWGMKEVVAKVKLPQRVPYGLHGHWFPPEELEQQRRPPSIRTCLPSRTL